MGRVARVCSIPTERASVSPCFGRGAIKDEDEGACTKRMNNANLFEKWKLGGRALLVIFVFLSKS